MSICKVVRQGRMFTLAESKRGTSKQDGLRAESCCTYHHIYRNLKLENLSCLHCNVQTIKTVLKCSVDVKRKQFLILIIIYVT